MSVNSVIQSLLVDNKAETSTAVSLPSHRLNQHLSGHMHAC